MSLSEKISEILLVGASIAIVAGVYFVPKSLEKMAKQTESQVRRGDVIPRNFNCASLFVGCSGYYDIRAHLDKGGESTIRYNGKNVFIQSLHERSSLF